VQSTADWMVGLYAAIVTQSFQPAHGTTPASDVVALIGATLRLDYAAAARALLTAIGQASPAIMALPPYVNQMSRYVRDPGAMLQAAALMDVQYPRDGQYFSKPSEMAARMLGRGNNTVDLARNIRRSAEETMAYTQAQIKVIHTALRALTHCAGCEANAVGPDIALPGEMAATKMASWAPQPEAVEHLFSKVEEGAHDGLVHAANRLSDRLDALLGHDKAASKRQPRP
jgi:hypothetical protein